MSLAEGNSTIVAAKIQSALGTPATGAGATLIHVRPSPGLAMQVATIESQILDRSGFRNRPRQGSQSVSGSYESELTPGNLDLPFAAVMGQTDAAVTLDETDLTSVVLSGSGTVATFGGGDLIALGLYRGRFVRFGTLATSANNGVWVPIIDMDPAAKTVTFPAGYLVDETIDSAFTMDVAKAFRAALARPKEYYTIEEYFDIDRSKVGTDQRFTGLSFASRANQMATAGFTVAGLDFDLLVAGSSPTFSAPTASEIAGADSMSMLDGAVFMGTEDVMDLTEVTLGLSSQSNITPLLRSRIGLGVSVPSFAMTASASGILTTEAADRFASFKNESILSLLVIARQAAALSSDFVGFYSGNAALANWNAPLADGDVPVTMPIYAGLDKRGESAGYARTPLVISTSAP